MVVFLVAAFLVVAFLVAAFSVVAFLVVAFFVWLMVYFSNILPVSFGGDGCGARPPCCIYQD